jgi:hypothetical protein
MALAINPTLFDLKPYTVKRKPQSSIEAIFTTRPDDPAAWAAKDAGLLVGCISSDKRLFDVERYEWAFKIEFIDNEYKAYNHLAHLGAVKAIRPKCATVRDLMTPEQCQHGGLEYYSFEQIMAWAEELSEYAQNVIVIPKSDCIEQIPGKFILGYSVPTADGGTPVPVEKFKGRRVHLLGGSFAEQLKKINELEGAVVSIDNNHIQLIAQRGDYITPDGRRKTLQDKGLGYLDNIRQAALTLSFGAIMARLREQ